MSPHYFLSNVISNSNYHSAQYSFVLHSFGRCLGRERHIESSMRLKVIPNRAEDYAIFTTMVLSVNSFQLDHPSTNLVQMHSRQHPIFHSCNEEKVSSQTAHQFHNYSSIAHLFSSRIYSSSWPIIPTFASSSGVKSETILNVVRISSGDFPLIRLATFAQLCYRMKKERTQPPTRAGSARN